MLYGLLSAYIFKRFRVLAQSTIVECTLIFCFGFISYMTSELLSLSGILTLLTTGILMAHYTWYNLSPQGKSSSSVALQVISYIVEGFVFAYIGLNYFSYTSF
jgi:NhaP-type Na+/H+ or K+/H+ antiporter